jgi:8-amino-7-oxononanoate synthase
MIKTNVYGDYSTARQAQGRHRTLQDSVIGDNGTLIRDGKTYVNFSGNDYLGLSKHPALIAAARNYAEKFGAGSTASRLIAGNHPAHAEIERKIAAGKKQESALVICSGYQANLTVIAALADAEMVGRPVTVIADRLAHNSILQGVMLGGARLMRFRHNDYDHLREILQKQKDAFTIIVSESVFGMDGDRADLKILSDLAQEFGSLLYIDEAHATGLFGENGFGLTTEYADGIDIAMGTFGKALGSFGSYIACSKTLRDYLIQKCGGLIYSTALPPAVLGSMNAALDLLPSLNQEREILMQNADYLRVTLRAKGYDCGDSTTQIIPIIIGGETETLAMETKLLTHGFLVPAIRPPTVPTDTSRLRLSLSAAHRREDIERFIDIIGVA